MPFVNKDSIKVNDISLGQYLVEVKYGYHKIWSKDTGRNLACTMSGTLKGIFPKLTMQFRSLSQTELELLAPIFDSAVQSVTYYDTKKKADTTITTYTNDWEVVNKAIGRNEGFSVAFISNSKRV